MAKKKKSTSQEEKDPVVAGSRQFHEEKNSFSITEDCVVADKASTLKIKYDFFPHKNGTFSINPDKITTVMVHLTDDLEREKVAEQFKKMLLAAMEDCAKMCVKLRTAPDPSKPGLFDGEQDGGE